MKIRKTPTTTNIDPATFFAVTRSRRKTIPDTVAKSGVVEEMGTACDYEV